MSSHLIFRYTQDGSSTASSWRQNHEQGRTTNPGLTPSKAEGSSLLFDSHSHPQFAAYDSDREKVIQRMKAQGVATIAVGTSYETSKAAIELARKYPGLILASIGIHPHHTTSAMEDSMESTGAAGKEALDARFSALAGAKEVVAIGESGLDYHYDTSDGTKQRQRESFFSHLELAVELKKPLIVHARDAYQETFEILNAYRGKLRGVMHFFQSSIDDARRFMDLGYYISFAGPITFATMYDAMVRFVPLDMMLLETDAPYAAPEPYRGKRNEPAYVRSVAEKVAELKNISIEKIAVITTKNAKTLFHPD